jgi:hypothetical protein
MEVREYNLIFTRQDDLNTLEWLTFERYMFEHGATLLNDANNIYNIEFWGNDLTLTELITDLGSLELKLNKEGV